MSRNRSYSLSEDTKPEHKATRFGWVRRIILSNKLNNNIYNKKWAHHAHGEQPHKRKKKSFGPGESASDGNSDGEGEGEGAGEGDGGLAFADGPVSSDQVYYPFYAQDDAMAYFESQSQYDFRVYGPGGGQGHGLGNGSGLRTTGGDGMDDADHDADAGADSTYSDSEMAAQVPKRTQVQIQEDFEFRRRRQRQRMDTGKDANSDSALVDDNDDNDAATDVTDDVTDDGNTEHGSFLTVDSDNVSTRPLISRRNSRKLGKSDTSTVMYGYEDSSRSVRSHTVTTKSIFDNASIPGTPETSVASGITNYTLQFNTNTNAARSVAYSYINGPVSTTGHHNDSASVITLASSTRNLLNRSKSARRSVETFNSSTMGIPPSSLLERLNNVGTSRTHASMTVSENARDSHYDDDMYSLGYF